MLYLPYMIYVAGDQHGWKAIGFVIEYLLAHGVAYENLGVSDAGQDRPLEEMLPPVAEKVRATNVNRAIVSCGTGVGVEVGMNKFAGIRAVLATNPQIASWSVEKDNCNVLCLVGWQAEKGIIYNILDAWFAARYDGSPKRLAMMKTFDTWH